MGVSIGWQPVEPKTYWLDVGWRSMMHSLLLDNNLYGQLGDEDIPTLLRVGREQMKGLKEPPFDFSPSIQKAFQSMARAIRKHGSIVVIYEF